jgi:hypothetical protein
MTWKPENFLKAYFSGPEPVAGYTYRGLGLHITIRESPKGRRPPTWSLTHLGTGLRIATIKGRVADAFPPAAAIAECGDWEFDGIDGWKNRDPDLPQKLVDTGAQFKNVTITAGGRMDGVEDIARQVAQARA